MVKALKDILFADNGSHSASLLRLQIWAAACAHSLSHHRRFRRAGDVVLPARHRCLEPHIQPAAAGTRRRSLRLRAGSARLRRVGPVSREQYRGCRDSGFRPGQWIEAAPDRLVWNPIRRRSRRGTRCHAPGTGETPDIVGRAGARNAWRRSNRDIGWSMSHATAAIRSAPPRRNWRKRLARSCAATPRPVPNGATQQVHQRDRCLFEA